jgi:hypothetical protein
MPLALAIDWDWDTGQGLPSFFSQNPGAARLMKYQRQISVAGPANPRSAKGLAFTQFVKPDQGAPDAAADFKHWVWATLSSGSDWISAIASTFLRWAAANPEDSDLR